MIVNSSNENNRLEKTDEQAQGQKHNQNKRHRIRKFPIWLRLITVFVLLLISLIVGLIVGYSVFGDGQAIEVFHKSTWQHIFDIVNKEE